VRYRYDATGRTRIKTVELIVERKELPAPRQIAADDVLVPVQMTIGDATHQKNGQKTMESPLIFARWNCASFFTVDESQMILLHGFMKKSNNTPRNELNTATARLGNYWRKKQ